MRSMQQQLGNLGTICNKYFSGYIPQVCNKNLQNAHWQMAGTAYPAIDQTAYMDV